MKSRIHRGFIGSVLLLPFLLLFQMSAWAQHIRTDSTRVVPKKLWYERFNPYLTDTLLQPVPLSRALFHDKIDNEQRKADAADGKTDGRVSVAGKPAATAHYTHALINRVDSLQVMVENMPAVDRDDVATQQQKIQALRAIWELLRQYATDPRPTPEFYDSLTLNMHDLIVAVNENKALDYVLANPDIYTLDNSRVLLDNKPEARAFIYEAIAAGNPVLMLRRLEEFARDTFASRIISAAARKEPGIVFSYATSSNMLLKQAVYACRDPYVQAIVRTSAESEAPLRALPFISYLYTSNRSIEEIDSIAANPVQSFNALTHLRRSNEPDSRQLYTDAMEYRTLTDFVRTMNEMHDTTDVVRFRCIDSLSAMSLFYIMVYGREEIYTSSFLGTFRRMTERMGSIRGNQFLDSLHYDHFRSFIRLCAGYNTLSAFLATMDDTARNNVMSRFAGGLEHGRENDLEDAVNVADAIGSITDSALLVFLRQRIAENYEVCRKKESRKGMAVYQLLGMLAESSIGTVTDTAAAQVSRKLHIQPVNILPYTRIANDTGTVDERVFFYGDDDGQTAYRGFIDDYKKNPAWKIDSNQYWATITATGGHRVTMYANVPLTAPDDEKAIDSLDTYLAAMGIKPRFIIHRGHSYHVKSTLKRIDSNARIVVLGSCGGYQNVAKVLKSSPDAHIIASRQTGVGAINEPMTRAINTQLQEGKDINWITLWSELDEYFSHRPELNERYKDYVPPHRNLGVIFIKAYRQLMAVTDI